VCTVHYPQELHISNPTPFHLVKPHHEGNETEDQLVMAAQSNLPQAAEEGFKDANAYDAYRPTYPLEVVEAFLQNLKVAKQDEAKIVEIASGTGKFTEILAARPERYTVKAVEPHGPMRDKLIQKDLRGVEVLDGKADKMPVDSEWGDACIAAQVSLPIYPLIPELSCSL